MAFHVRAALAVVFCLLATPGSAPAICAPRRPNATRRPPPRQSRPQRRSSHPDRQRRRLGRRRRLCGTDRPRAGSSGYAQHHRGFGHLRREDRQDHGHGRGRLRGSAARVRSDTGALRCARRREFRQGQFPDLRPQRPRLRARKCRCIPTARSISRRCATRPARWAIRIGCCRPPRSTLDTNAGAGHRARRGHALQGRADFLHAVFRVPTGRRAPERLVVPELRAFRQQRLPARGALLLQLGAELRCDPDARLFIRARRAARRRISLLDGELAAVRSKRISSPTMRSRTAIAPTCTSPTSPTSSPGCASIPTSPASATAATSRTSRVGTDQTSVTFLERRADILYYDDAWRVRAQLQNFQTIDTSVDAGDRPYSRVPRVEAYGLWPILDSKFEFAVEQRGHQFRTRGRARPACAWTSRPELRWSDRTAGYFFEPAIGYHFTQYDLQNAAYGDPSTPTPTAAVRAGSTPG